MIRFPFAVIVLFLASQAAAAATTPPGTRVSQSVYDAILHYTRYPFFSNGHTPGTSFAPCKSYPYGTALVKNINVNLSDTQAQIFRDDNAKEFVLSLPGTESIVDALTDLDFTLIPFVSPGVTTTNCQGCFVHMGFFNAWVSIKDAATSKLRAGLKAHPGYRVVVSGHSLGGAIAALAAFSMKASDLPVTAVYTFGQPRTGNKAFADATDKLFGAFKDDAGQFHRVTHFSDPVPQLPPQILGSRHSRTEYFESQNSTFGAKWTYRCAGQESPSCNDRFAPLDRTVDAHTTYSGVSSDGKSSCG